MLDATEKNPNVEGSLASSINSIEDDIKSYFTAPIYVTALPAGKWTTVIEFTISEAGYYEFHWCLDFSSGTGSYIQGTRIRFNTDNDVPFLHMSIANQESAYSEFFANKCNEGDIIRIQMYSAVQRNITNQKIMFRKIKSKF